MRNKRNDMEGQEVGGDGVELFLRQRDHIGVEGGDMNICHQVIRGGEDGQV